MTTGRRALSELEDMERKLKRIVTSINAGNGDLQEIRTTIERILRNELSEVERLLHRIRDAD